MSIPTQNQHKWYDDLPRETKAAYDLAEKKRQEENDRAEKKLQKENDHAEKKRLEERDLQLKSASNYLVDTLEDQNSQLSLNIRNRSKIGNSCVQLSEKNVDKEHLSTIRIVREKDINGHLREKFPRVDFQIESSYGSEYPAWDGIFLCWKSEK